jgi:hypothetical protein
MIRVTCILDDGSKYEVDQDRPPFPDLCAFERQFGMSSTVLQIAQEHIGRAMVPVVDATGQPVLDDDGDAMTELDTSKLDPAKLPRNEWAVFFAWRRLRRRGEPVTSSFELFLEHLDEVRFDQVELDADVDKDGSLGPTSPAAAPG